MGSEELLLSDSIIETIYNGQKIVSKLFSLIERNTADNTQEGSHAEAQEETELTLKFYIEKAFRETAVLAERLGLPLYRNEIVARRRGIEDLTSLWMAPFDIEHRSIGLDAANEMYQPLATMLRGRNATGIGVFETILDNTAKIIVAAGMNPENETKVKDEIRKVLSFSFRDVVREISIPKTIKTYKPDIGVISLSAAAEYKFIDSKIEAKASLDGIYADMKGYSGSHAWQSFYAVFYMTQPFYSQKDFDEEFRLVGAEINWKPIAIVGPGGRKKQKVAPK